MYSRFLLASLKLIVSAFLEALLRRIGSRTPAVKSAANYQDQVPPRDDTAVLDTSKNGAK